MKLTEHEISSRPTSADPNQTTYRLQFVYRYKFLRTLRNLSIHFKTLGHKFSIYVWSVMCLSVRHKLDHASMSFVDNTVCTSLSSVTIASIYRNVATDRADGIWLGGFFLPIPRCVIGKLGYLEKLGYFLCNFVPNSGLRKFDHGNCQFVDSPACWPHLGLRRSTRSGCFQHVGQHFNYFYLLCICCRAYFSGFWLLEQGKRRGLWSEVLLQGAGVEPWSGKQSPSETEAIWLMQRNTVMHSGQVPIQGRRLGGHVPQHFGWGDAKVKSPPLIAHLVKFLGHIFHLDKLDYCISGVTGV